MGVLNRAEQKSVSDSDPEIVQLTWMFYFPLGSVTIGNAAALVDRNLKHSYDYLPWISDTF